MGLSKLLMARSCIGSLRNRFLMHIAQKNRTQTHGKLQLANERLFLCCVLSRLHYVIYIEISCIIDYFCCWRAWNMLAWLHVKDDTRMERDGVSSIKPESIFLRMRTTWLNKLTRRNIDAARRRRKLNGSVEETLSIGISPFFRTRINRKKWRYTLQTANALIMIYERNGTYCTNKMYFLSRITLCEPKEPTNIIHWMRLLPNKYCCRNEYICLCESVRLQVSFI